MKSILYSVMAIAVAITLSSCGKSNDQLNQEQSTSDTTTAASPTTAPGPDLVIAMSPANIAAGKSTYETTCYPCHGTGGKGDGPAAVALNPKPRDHTNGEYMNKLTNRHIFDIVHGGGANFNMPGMPAQPRLADDSVKNIIAFVRTLAQNPPYTPPASGTK
jgi:mono/diheme cytochrome c family protein